MNIRRFITWLQTGKVGPDGLILSGSNSGGYQPKSNTWHGGIDEEAETETIEVPWYISSPDRLQTERNAVDTFFPGFEFFLESDQMKLRGKLTTLWGISFKVEIIYPPNFPEGAPRVYVKTFLKGNPPHIYKSGHLCLFDRSEPAERRWEPEDTVALIIAWTAKWLHCYVYWSLITKMEKWPEPDKKPA